MLRLLLVVFVLGQATLVHNLDQCVADCMNYNAVKQKQCAGVTGSGDDPLLPPATPRACILNYPEICLVKCQNNIPF